MLTLGATMPKRIQDLPEEYLTNQRALAQAIGARVRLRRSKLDLTQEHLRARMELAQVYISRTQYSRIENGETLPNAAELIALSAILGVSFDWLLLEAGVFFRRDQIEPLRAKLLGVNRPTNPNEWRQEFLDFARSRNLSKSYKPVLLKSLLKLVNRRGEADIDALTKEFRAFYGARQQAGVLVEFGPPDLSDPMTVNDSQLRQLIVRHPLERFLIKGFLEYLPTTGVIRFAPYLWADLRFWELLDIQQSADQQLEYYYARSP